jgi:hypothetical protein
MQIPPFGGDMFQRCTSISAICNAVCDVLLVEF